MHETDLLDLTGSGRPRISRSCVVQRRAVADWWYSWPMASALASLCLSQRRTFWTYVVTTGISLFSLYLMNSCFTPCLMLQILLWQHYKSMKRYALFSQGSVRTLVRRARWTCFSYMSKKFLPLYISAKIIKIDQDFPKLWSQMYCHLILWFTVYV